MSLREKIANVVIDNCEEVLNWEAEAAADAILSTIAESVPPLEWVEESDFHCPEIFQCETDFGRYCAYTEHERPGYFALLEDGATSFEAGPFETMSEAKAAAQADRTSRILKAAGIEV